MDGVWVGYFPSLATQPIQLSKKCISAACHIAHLPAKVASCSQNLSSSSNGIDISGPWKPLDICGMLSSQGYKNKLALSLRWRCVGSGLSGVAACMVQVVDKEAGADCKRVLKAASTSRARSAILKQRFQEGAVDEVSFLGASLTDPSVYC
jgi:hypothetical protein